MKATEVEQKLGELTASVNKEEFIYDFLLAYGISKASVTRLKKGDYNLSKVKGEVLYKNKLFFKEEQTDRLLIETEELAKKEVVIRQNPRFIILTDFKTIVARDLKKKVNRDFPFTDLPKYYDFFLPLSGAEIYKSSNDNKADRDAAYQLAQLYDHLITDNPDIYAEGSHKLNVFLSRLLFCFFAEDTGIFDKESLFTETLALRTHESGSNVHEFLNELFKKLNSEAGDFPAYLQPFPYVNGGLFRDDIQSPAFSAKARKILVDCGDLNWSEINPDIFGSMIQAVADPAERSDLGMHYTSVPNIRKLIDPLFLDELKEEFENNQDNANNVKKLIARLSKIKFFDPACGSGNFLIITYKEIRLLEIKMIQRLIELEKTPLFSSSAYVTSISLTQFYGIEIKDFPHEMALLSLWLAEHQMNKVFDEMLEGYGKSKAILPLKEAGKIVCGNAVRNAWEVVCPKNVDDEIYILGNPPYLGYSMQKEVQKKDMEIALSKVPNYKKLDYISCWIIKASDYIKESIHKFSFVTTNSVAQGEQVSLLFPYILNANQELYFVHQSFKWTNNARGNAGVTVVIIGIRTSTNKEKFIFAGNIRKNVKNISPYLTEFNNIIIFPRLKPLSHLPEMIKGSSPCDDSNLLLEQDDYLKIIANYPNAVPFIKKYIGSHELMQSTHRYCIYVSETDLGQIEQIKPFLERFNNVKKFREKSSKIGTQELAKKPFRFGEDRYKNSDSIIIPRVSSERREYIPLGFLNLDTIISDSAMAVYDAEPWLFGMLHSKMHMVWVNAVGGKLKTDYRYSNTLCYNTFPFPNISEKQKETINQYVFLVLDERAKYSDKTMAWMYNPETMPAGLKQAHKDLDEAIERIYRLAPFQNDAERLEYLFKLYEEMISTNTLFAKEKKSRKKKEQ